MEPDSGLPVLVDAQVGKDRGYKLPSWQAASRVAVAVLFLHLIFEYLRLHQMWPILANLRVQTAITAALILTVIAILPPLLAMLAVFLAVTLAVDDLIVFMRGGTSVIGAFVDGVLKGNEVWEAFLRLMRAIASEFVTFMSLLRLVAAIFVELLTPAWLVFRDAILLGVGEIVDALSAFGTLLFFLTGIDLNKLITDLDLMTMAVKALQAVEESLLATLRAGLETARQFSETIQKLSEQGNLVEMGLGAAGGLLAAGREGVASTGADLLRSITNNTSNTVTSSPAVNVMRSSSSKPPSKILLAMA